MVLYSVSAVKIAFGRSIVMVGSMSNQSLISLKMAWRLAFAVSPNSAGNCVSSLSFLIVIPWRSRINDMLHQGLILGPVSSVDRLSFLTVIRPYRSVSAGERQLVPF